MLQDRTDIRNYAEDGFQHVCDIEHYKDEWIYKNINTSVMYDSHDSWVYAVTVDDKIKKIGESGHPLGKRSDTTNQPKSGTDNRLGRYRKGDGTDARCRQQLKKYTDPTTPHTVSIYAKKCPIVQTEQTIAGMTISVQSTIHKQLEKEYLDYYKRSVGRYPDLNTGRA